MMGVIIGIIYLDIGYTQVILFYFYLLIELIDFIFKISFIYFFIFLKKVSITDRYGLFFILSSLFPFMVILNTIAQCNLDSHFYFPINHIKFN